MRMKDLVNKAASIVSSSLLLASAMAGPIRKEVIGQSEGKTEVYRLIYGTDGDAAWNEIDSVNKNTKVAKVIVQDEILFTNERTSGGSQVPLENKVDLANIYAKYVIEKAGGIDKYREEMSHLSQYGIPEPTGLFKEALDRLGVLNYQLKPENTKSEVSPKKIQEDNNKSHSIDFQ